MKRWIAVVGALVIIAAVMVGCGGQKAKKLSFALCPKSLNNPYWQSVEQGMDKAAKELGVEAKFVAPVEADVAKQVSMIEGVVQQGKDGIAISPNDPSSVRGVISRAIKKGIPTITFDSDAPESERICYVGTDNFAAGKEAGKQLAKFMGGKGTVVIITGGLGALNLNQRIAGFKDALKAYPSMKILNTYPCNDDQARAHEIIEGVLRSRQDLGGIFAVGLWAVLPAGKILSSTGKAGKVKVVGFDTLESELELVKNGSVQALIGQRPYEMGYRSVKVLYDLANGKKPASKIIPTGVDIVTSENVDQFLAKKGS